MLVELNIPVVNVKLANANVPLVNVTVPVPYNANAAPNVVVPDVLLIINAPNVALPLLVIVPVLLIVAVKERNVPPFDNVNELKFIVVAGIENAVVPKSRLLNHDPVVNVGGKLIPVPNVKFGALALVPPAVLPKSNVRVKSVSPVNPPVPVHVNPVAVAINKPVELPLPSAILLVPKLIERVFALSDLKALIVKL